METRRDERIGQLLQALKRSDKLHLKEAATLLGVSEMTIRRDLNHKSAPVVLLGGYIVLEPRSASHYLLSDQKSRLVEEKRRAAQLAAGLIQAHQTIFIDCGTTTPGLLKPLMMTFPLRRYAIRLIPFWRCRKNLIAVLSSAAGSFTPATRFLNHLISMKR